MDPSLSPGGTRFLMEVSPVGGILTLPPSALGRGRGEERLADCRPAPSPPRSPAPTSAEERISQTGYSCDSLHVHAIIILYSIFICRYTFFKTPNVFLKKKKRLL